VSTSSRSSSPARPPASSSPARSFAELVCLTLIEQGVSHGWALGTTLAPDGAVGRIWSLSRPLTYRAVDGLVDKRLVARRGEARGHGRNRMTLVPTPAGRRLSKRWLDVPVEHLRDVRTELLVKLTLRERAGLGNEQLLEAQRRQFGPAIDVLTTTHPGDDLVGLWRRESARAVRRFLDQALHPALGPVGGQPALRLSARNQLRATVTQVTHGEVMSTVKVVLGDGQHLTAAITKESAEELDVALGDAVVVIVKATEVMVAKDERWAWGERPRLVAR
jgi:molybdopterin-binding protein